MFQIYGNVSYSKIRLGIKQTNTSFDDILIDYHGEAANWIDLNERNIGIDSTAKIYAESAYACYLFRTRNVMEYSPLSTEDGGEFLKQAKQILDSAISGEEEEDDISYFYELTP